MTLLENTNIREKSVNKRERDIIREDITGYRIFVVVTVACMFLECLLNLFKEQISKILNNFGQSYAFFNWFYDNLDINTLFSTQVMVAALMLSVVTIIACNVNDRCLNISYKRIFFKPFVYKNNYVTLAFKMMITIFIGIIEFFLGLRIMLFFTLIITTYFLFRLLEMTYVMISKKSLIYIRLYDTIKIDNNVFKICVDKIRDWQISKNESSHNQYIIQELALLQLIIEKSDNEEDIIKCKECASNLIGKEDAYFKNENTLNEKISKTHLFDKDVDKKQEFIRWLKQLLHT